MKVGQVIGYIAAAILIFFGVIFIWGTFDQQGQLGWLAVGGVSLVAGLVLVWLVGRRAKKDTVEVVQKIELSGDVSLEEFSCKNCGGTLSSSNVKMVAGAPVVECPYCNASYQLEEEPKW